MSNLSTTWKIVIGVAVAAVLLIAVVLMAGRKSDDSAAAGPSTTLTPPTTAARAAGGSTTSNPIGTAPADASTTTVAPTVPTSGASTPTSTADAAPTTSSAPTPTTPRVTAPLPVSASVSGASGVTDGQAVKIHVEPEGGSQAFGFEAWLCRGDATFTNDLDVRPLQTGKCLPQPLSARSDSHVEVDGTPPYGALDGSFRVGVGSLTYKTVSGQSVTITCNASSPCQIVLKLQYPNGFGFKAFPIAYA